MKNSVVNLLKWQIIGRKNADDHPDRLITLRPPAAARAIPVEVAMLLPVTEGNRALLKAVEQKPVTACCALGLCLVDPFLNLATLSDRLTKLGVRWVANFPSVAQHEAAFESYLDDVDLGLRHELDRLGTLKGLGFKTLSVMCHNKDAAAIAATNPDAVLHIPNVASFLSGVPDAPDLAAKEETMRAALIDYGWTGTFLNYCVSQDKPSTSGPALIRP